MKHAVLILLFALSTLARAETWSFGLIGDVPYSERERAELPDMLEAMAAQKLNLIAHIGDIKSGKTRCDDAVYADRKALFNSSPVPFVFVPGDNEWSDCKRLSNGHYEPLERLQSLRQHFYPDDLSLGKNPLRLDRQKGDYPEHSRFRLGPVLFITLNVPGNNNNYGPRAPGSAEFQARNKQVLAWLRESFKLARRTKLRGVVVMMQANPALEHHAQGFAHSGYRHLLDQLRDETQRFSGHVVLVHGDTHRNRVDQPLHTRQGIHLDNFTRVETYGFPFMGWTRVVIDTENPWLFQFESRPWYGKGTKAAASNR